MYKRIEAQLVLKGISKKELACNLGIGYNTLLAKMRGISDFTLNEALKTKEIIHAVEPVEELFKRSDAERLVSEAQKAG